MRAAIGRGIDRQVGQPAPVLDVPDADFAGPVGGDDLRLVVGEDGLERQVAERLEFALLAAILVPEPDHAIAAGREQPPILGEPDRGDPAAVGAEAT